VKIFKEAKEGIFSLTDMVAIFTFIVNLFFIVAAFSGLNNLNDLKKDIEITKNSLKQDILELNLDFLSSSVLPNLLKSSEAVDLWDSKSIVRVMVVNSNKYSDNKAYLKYDKIMFDRYYNNVVIKLLDRLSRIESDEYKEKDIEKIKAIKRQKFMAITYTLNDIKNIFPDFFYETFNKEYKKPIPIKDNIEKYTNDPIITSALTDELKVYPINASKNESVK
jgi:hypothetical protein